MQRRWVAERALTTPPAGLGSYAYSNIGYVLVGAILERTTGLAWEELMRTRLFEPLGMASAGFGAPATPGLVDQPWGHAADSGRLVPIPPGPEADNPPVLGPAGTVHCYLGDWARFVVAHLHGARGEPSLVSAESFVRMHAPWPGGDYALGWVVLQDTDGRILAHDGSNESFYVAVFIRPDRNTAVLAASNAGGPSAEAGILAAIRLLESEAAQAP